MIVHRDAYAAVGPFDTRYVHTEDYDMLVRLALYGPCAGSDDVVFLQRQHEGERGTKAQRFSARDRELHWIASETAIFERLRGELSLDAYLPAGRSVSCDADRREALIQRGCIMGRKKLWAHAAADFRKAAELDCGPLLDVERDTLRRTFASKYGCAELISDSDAVRSLIGVRRAGPTGPEIVKSLGRGLVWRIREAARAGRVARAAGFSVLAARLSS